MTSFIRWLLASVLVVVAASTFAAENAFDCKTENPHKSTSWAPRHESACKKCVVDGRHVFSFGDVKHPAGSCIEKK